MKFELEEYHRNISRDDLIKDLKRIATFLEKQSVTQAEYNRLGKYSSHTFIRKFGSWLKALGDAGLEKTRNLHLTEEELIQDLIRVSKELKKKSVTTEEYKIYGHYSISSFASKFGSWFKALERVGLEKTRNLGVTEEEYFTNLEEVWAKLGRQPKSDDMHKPLSKYSAGAYEYRFGTWIKALEKFIDYINKEKIPKVEAKKEQVIDKTTILYKHKTKRNINWRLRFIIMRRDNFKCKICGRSPATDPKITLHVDHIIPWTKEGETIPDNLHTLCSVCNIGKSNLEM